MDDDMNWRVANVTDFIHTTVKPEKKAFYCERSERGISPTRDRRNKWFLTMEEYPYAELPTYCRGGSYIATMPAVHHVLQNVHSSRFLWLEDVFITGMLNRNEGATVVDIGRRRFFRNKANVDSFDYAWFYHLRYRNVTVVQGYKLLNEEFA